jgi:hypothetical protein
MSNDVISQLRTYLDFAGGEPVDQTLAAAPPVKPVLRWYQRGPVVAAVVALLVLAVGVPALLLSSNTEPPVGSQLPDPLDVGVDRVWPDAGFAGDADMIAAEFAGQALGWTNVETVSDPEATPDGPVWTTIQHAGSEDLDVLSIPIGDGRRALIQVGSPGVFVRLADQGQGQRVVIPHVAEAESAVLHIRFVEPDRVDVIVADRSDLEQGRVEVASISPIGGIVVVYLDANGDSVTATGGHFGPFEAPPSPSATEPQPTSTTSTTTTTSTTVQPTGSDISLVEAFVEFANSPSAETFSSLPLADSLALGLGPQIIRSVDKNHLQDREAWVIDVAEFRAYTGPFSSLDVLGSLDQYTVQVGEHSHCAGPPQPPPDGLEDNRRISVQPSDDSMDSCLMWTTVDFFVGPSGLVEAITMDVWEP